MYVSNKLRRGLGATTCPSYQQLVGIEDPTDPCQSLPVGYDASSPVDTSGIAVKTPANVPDSVMQAALNNLPTFSVGFNNASRGINESFVPVVDNSMPWLTLGLVAAGLIAFSAVVR